MTEGEDTDEYSNLSRDERRRLYVDSYEGYDLLEIEDLTLSIRYEMEVLCHLGDRNRITFVFDQEDMSHALNELVGKEVTKYILEDFGNINEWVKENEVKD